MYRLKSLTRREFWWHKLMRRYVIPTNHKIEELGKGYGGWHVPTDMIQSDWVIYSFGIGEDITFDSDMIKRFDCVVYGFDPTPRAVKYAQSQTSLLPNFKFYPYGVWSDNTVMKFYNPRKTHFASYSILNLRHQDDFMMAECKTIKTLMAELGHMRVDLIKMDIEGAEQMVLPNLIEDNIQTKVLCVEYDQPVEIVSRLAWQCFWQSIRLTRQLKQAGYHLICVEGLTATYLHHSVI